MKSLEFPIYKIISANKDRFTSYPIWMPFISLSCLIVLARTSSTMFNKSGEGRHPGLIPDLRGKTLSLSLLSMILAVSLLYMALMLRFLPSVLNLLKFSFF